MVFQATDEPFSSCAFVLIASCAHVHKHRLPPGEGGPSSTFNFGTTCPF